MPSRDQHRIYEHDGEEFVMFVVKTAKRKGYLRPCGRPLDTKYDPWAKEVMEYMESEDEYPFLLHPNHGTSKTYAMNKAKEVFRGLYWPMTNYIRGVHRLYSEDMVRTQRWGKDGYEEYLVVLPDGERGWTKSREYVIIGEKVMPRWKPVTSHVLRKASLQTLTYTYGLDDVDSANYGGWTVSGSRTGVSASMGKHYLYMDLSETEAALPQLERIFRRYASKLLVDYSLLV